jgi:methionyl-tRNA formyltransferase
MDSGEATEVLAKLGADILADELPSIISGTARREPQDDEKATYAPPVRREEGHIDFSRTPDEVVRKVLAMTPSPGAYAMLGGDKIRVWRACASHRAADARSAGAASRPGCVIFAGEGVIRVASGHGGSVDIERLQSPGGKPMSSADWLRGHSIEVGAAFE